MLQKSLLVPDSPMPNHSSGSHRFWQRLTLATSMLVLATIFFYPLSSDTCGIQWVALRLVKNGLLPYVGTWEPNFLGTLAFHIPAVLLFGNSEIGFRIIEWFCQVVAVMALFRLSTQWLSARSAFFAAFAYIILTVHGGFLYFGQRDVFAAGLLIIALDLWFKSDIPSVRNIILLSVSFGLALLIRPFYALLPLCLIAVYWPTLRWRNRVIFGMGVLLPTLLSLIPYVLTGTLGIYFETTIKFFSLYASVPAPPYRDMLHVLWEYRPILVFTIIALIPASRIPSRWSIPAFLIKPFGRREKALYASLVISILLIILLQHRFLLYHFAPLFALVAPLAGVGIDRVIVAIPYRSIRIIFNLAIPLILLLLFTPFVPILARAASMDWVTEGYGGSFLPADSRAWRTLDDSVIGYLQKPWNSLGAVEVCSYDARLRLRLDREPATRFLYFQAFSITDSHGDHPPFQQAWRREFINGLRSKPARFIILNGYMNFWGYDPPRVSLPKDFPELDSLLQANYTKDTTFGSYQLYRINSLSPSLSAGANTH